MMLLCKAKPDDIPRWDRKRFQSTHPLRNYGWLPREGYSAFFQGVAPGRLIYSLDAPHPGAHRQHKLGLMSY